MSDAEVTFQEERNLFHADRICVVLQFTYIFIYLSPAEQQVAGKHLSPVDHRAQRRLRYYIVNIANNNHVLLQCIQIVQKGTMTSGTENQQSVLVPERSVLDICSEGVGRRTLC
ncbi:MAG: hypothetical protein BWX52_00587 [Bacteroidetes bacterium ADurb.Bin013]|nr:MAG: hypothetical protein BWX52_00587 [Bacteroidetes bacterium ADurb.Bin013]